MHICNKSNAFVNTDSLHREMLASHTWSVMGHPKLEGTQMDTAVWILPTSANIYTPDITPLKKHPEIKVL